MASKKTRLQAKAAKQRRQKLIVIGGAVLLVIVLAIQVPKTMKMLNGGSSAQPTASTATQPVTTTPADQAGQPISAPSGGELPDRNAEPEPADGQLTSFELFPSKDPFSQQVTEQTGEGATVDGGQASTSEASPAGGASGSGGEQAAASAVIAVNGTEETVQVSQTFPASDPSFVLVSVGSASAKIGIAGGKLADGAGTVTLKLGKSLTLVNTVDGTRYELVLRSIG